MRAYEEEAQCLTEPSQAPRTRGRSRIIYKIRSCITVTCGDHAYPDSDSRGIVRDQSVAISAVRLVDSDLPHDFEPGILLHVEARGGPLALLPVRARGFLGISSGGKAVKTRPLWHVRHHRPEAPSRAPKHGARPRPSRQAPACTVRDSLPGMNSHELPEYTCTCTNSTLTANGISPSRQWPSLTKLSEKPPKRSAGVKHASRTTSPDSRLGVPRYLSNVAFKHCLIAPIGSRHNLACAENSLGRRCRWQHGRDIRIWHVCTR